MANMEFIKEVLKDIYVLDDASFNSKYGKSKDTVKEEYPDINTIGIAEECPIE